MKYYTLIFLFLTIQVHAKNQVTLYLKWKHQYQFAGYYAAVKNGYFKDQGLEVTLVERDPKWDVISKVDGKVGSYGVSDSSVVLHYLLGKDVLIVNSIFQYSPLVLATLKSSGIKTPLDLKNKNVMYQKDIDDATFKLMFYNSGIKENEFKTINHSFNNNDLINGKVDAISIYDTNQPYFFKELGIPINIIKPENYGVDLYGDILITSKQEADAYPERVKKMREAVLKGWKYALENPIEISKYISDTYSKKYENIVFESEQTKKYIRPDQIPLGTTSLPRLYRIADLYLQHQKKDLNAHQTLDRVLFDRYQLTKQFFSRSSIRKIYIYSSLGIFLLLVLVLFNYKLKKEVKKKEDELKKHHEEKELFFSNMTHELRTPLNAIMGSLSLIENEQNEKQLIDYYKVIKNSSRNLLSIVDDILDLTKLDKGKMTLSLEEVDFQTLLKNAYQFHELEAKNKGLDFTIQSNIDEKIFVKIDPIRFSQVINNLLSNANKFTSTGSISINVHFEQIENKAKFEMTIKDTGKGISSEKINSIFEPFKQEDEKVFNKYGGTGLGLMICKQILELMNGGIYVKESQLDRGSTFVMNFECELITEPGIVKEQISNNFDFLKNTKVLVVEDNTVNGLLVKKILEKYEILVDLAENGEVALDKIGKNEYDLVFMDKVMPLLDGIQTTKKLREHQDARINSIYVVGFSANWKNGKDPECMENGLNASLSKPIIIENLERVFLDYHQEIKNKSAA